MTTVSKTISSDFGGKLNVRQFFLQISDDPTLVTPLQDIAVSGDNVDIIFTSTISGAESTALDSLITAYVFEASVQNFISLLDGNTSDTIDAGFYNQYVDNGVTKYTGFSTQIEPRRTVTGFSLSAMKLDSLDVDSGISAADLSVAAGVTIGGNISITGLINDRDPDIDGANLDAHIADLINPHSVTYQQIKVTTTKGDLVVDNGITGVRIPVGGTGQVLTVDSSTDEGFVWKDSGTFLGVGVTSDTCKIWDEKETATNGGRGLPSSIWRTRDLNMIENDLNGDVSLGISASFTLKTGKYVINTITPAAAVKSFSTRIQNITDDITVVYGSSGQSAGKDASNNFSFAIGLVEVGITTEFEVQQIVEKGTPITSYGAAAGFAGVPEIYTQVSIKKIFAI